MSRDPTTLIMPAIVDNPLSEEGEYRTEVLITIPSIKQLDGETFEPEEREEANEVRKEGRQRWRCEPY